MPKGPLGLVSGWIPGRRGLDMEKAARLKKDAVCFKGSSRGGKGTVRVNDSNDSALGPGRGAPHEIPLLMQAKHPPCVGFLLFPPGGQGFLFSLGGGPPNWPLWTI